MQFFIIHQFPPPHHTHPRHWAWQNRTSLHYHCHAQSGALWTHQHYPHPGSSNSSCNTFNKLVYNIYIMCGAWRVFWRLNGSRSGLRLKQKKRERAFFWDVGVERGFLKTRKEAEAPFSCRDFGLWCLVGLAFAGKSDRETSNRRKILIQMGEKGRQK